MRKIFLLATCILSFSRSVTSQTFYTGLNGLGETGVISKFDATKNQITKVFETSNLGQWPSGNLLLSGGKLYGMTNAGGNYGVGTIYSIDPITHVHTKLKDFDNLNGGMPYLNGMTRVPNGKFYGITTGGGNSNAGVLFSFDPSTNTLLKLHDFEHSSGIAPSGNLVLASDGKLYGCTAGGGNNNNGVIFSVTLGGDYTKLFDFPAGEHPSAGLIQASDGKLYGTTNLGGAYNYGTIFSYTLGGIYTKLYDFDYLTTGGGISIPRLCRRQMVRFME